MEVTLSNALEDVNENERDDDVVDDGDAEDDFVPLEESEECNEFVIGWRGEKALAESCQWVAHLLLGRPHIP